MAKIEELKETYNGEWLAIEILTESPSGPQEGELIYHSKIENDVWRKIKGDRRRIYVTYAGPFLEDDYVAAF